jgi:hypothetical protein
LRVEYSKIRRLLVGGTYSPAKQLIRRGIRLASRHKAYRSLCSMYFIASALYYETGDYGRATRFLDRTIRVAKENAIPELVYDFMLRHAFISEKLGLFGNAIEVAQSVAYATGVDVGRQPYFSSSVALLDMLVTINNHSADQLVERLGRVAEAIEDRNRLASYHRALGYYYVKVGNLERAMSEFSTARGLFSAAKMRDDLAETEIAMAAVMIRNNRIDEAENLLSAVKSAVDVMESNELRARYLSVELARLVKSGAGNERIHACMNSCEAIRPRVTEVKVALDLDAELFRSALAIGEAPLALEVFDRYYRKVRHIVSNLPEKYAADYVKDPELTEIIELYRGLKTQDPGPR